MAKEIKFPKFISHSNGTNTVTWYDVNGAVTTPPAEADCDIIHTELCYKAIVDTADYSIGDKLYRIDVLNACDPLTPLWVLWKNITTNSVVFSQEKGQTATGTQPTLTNLSDCSCNKKVVAVNRVYDVVEGTSTGLNTYTLFSKLSNPHPDGYVGIQFIGELLNSATGNSTHPAGAAAGQSINGWNVFAICSATQPADDSNNHYWIQGVPSSFAASLTYDGAVAADPVCENTSNCIPVYHVIRENCEGVVTETVETVDASGTLIPYTPIGTIQDICSEPSTECTTSELVLVDGNYISGGLAANQSITIPIPAGVLARNLIVQIRYQDVNATNFGNSFMELEITYNNTDTVRLATYGNSFELEQQKCESYVTSITLNDLSTAGFLSEFIVMFSSHNANTTD